MGFNTFDAIQIGLASPEKLREMSHGEVKKPETINYRTLKPEREGLFCERIFGPTKDWECHCGKYKKIRFKGLVCDRCGVEVTRAKVRRERMGHIELAAPVSHIWYFKGIPSRMGLMLDISPRNLEKVLYFAAYIVIDPGKTDLVKKQILNEKEYKEKYEKYGDKFTVGMGAEAIKELLAEIDLEETATQLHIDLENAQGQKRARIIKKLEVVDSFRLSGNRPEWMILDVVPVIPPEIRPMVQLDGGRFATSDLNDLYRRVINRNNRLKRLLELHAPDIIVRNEKRMLQESVDALIDNGRRGKPVTGPGNRPLKSLSDMLKGKQGRFRQNLLGKRVDYSGRSVIVVGPELKIYQCGLPKEMALELFKPFVMKKLVNDQTAQNIKNAKRLVDRADDAVWDVLEKIIEGHPVLLNRAPTLHRLGIQAFEPVLVEGRAIRLHPLVCTAFNADFAGDQMAVHVPLSPEAQAEARFLMLSANNLLKPQDGKPVTIPTQDMILGSYYLTIRKDEEILKKAKPSEIPAERTFETEYDALEALEAGKIKEYDIIKVKDNGIVYKSEIAPESDDGYIVTHCKLLTMHAYKDFDEAQLAYGTKSISLHEPILVRSTDPETGVSVRLETTVGRIIFNSYVPQDLDICDRSTPEDRCRLEIEEKVTKKVLGKIINACIDKHGITETAIVLDNIKSKGYKYSTISGITVGASDMQVPEAKPEIIRQTEAQTDRIQEVYKRGFMSESDRKGAVVAVWNNAIDEITDKLMHKMAGFDEDYTTGYNPIHMMADSGARGSRAQIRQLAGIRGLMADTTGETIEIPIKSSFREGIDVIEFFLSAHGARKGLADTALRTADSGYLTRRLVDVSQEVIIREDDCGGARGIIIKPIENEKQGSSSSDTTIEAMPERLYGRVPVFDIVDPATGEVLAKANEVISKQAASKIDKAGIREVEVRSVITCNAKVGVCAKCYGMNLATGKLVDIGESVGIIAAQSIGEPGTQLTMRTFHSGGVASAEGDLTQGLPRVEELFEARKPKGAAVISAIKGTVRIEDSRRGRIIYVDGIDENAGEVADYTVSVTTNIVVKSGDTVEKAQRLTSGHINPTELLAVTKDANAVQEYLVKEVQKVYKTQGVDISDKHIEVIIRQMMRKLKVEDPGNIEFEGVSLLANYVDRSDYNKIVDEIEGYREKKQELRDKASELRKAGDLGQAEEIDAQADAIQLPIITDYLMGITKASLATESFLSAASFQETTRVLTDAAIKGKIDPLIGLKENVIIGKLIPAGTGLQVYNDIDVHSSSDDSNR